MTEFNVGFEEHGIGVEHFMPAGDGVYIKKVTIPAGKRLDMHVHTFTHKSVLAMGCGILFVAGNRRVIKSGEILQVESGVEHAFEARSDCTWLCIHATSETDPERIDHTLVKES